MIRRPHLTCKYIFVSSKLKMWGKNKYHVTCWKCILIENHFLNMNLVSVAFVMLCFFRWSLTYPSLHLRRLFCWLRLWYSISQNLFRNVRGSGPRNATDLCLKLLDICNEFLGILFFKTLFCLNLGLSNTLFKLGFVILLIKWDNERSFVYVKLFFPVMQSTIWSSAYKFSHMLVVSWIRAIIFRYLIARTCPLNFRILEWFFLRPLWPSVPPPTCAWSSSPRSWQSWGWWAFWPLQGLLLTYGMECRDEHTSFHHSSLRRNITIKP